MEKNQRNPRRRLNSLILLVAFTAVMLIVSTYAWFTAQKTVMIGNLEGKVNVAEGIEISLDAVNWSQEVDFTKFAAAGVGQYTGLSKIYGDAAAPNHNTTPSELIPVTTTGKENTTNAATGGNEIKFYSAIAKANSELSTTAIDEIYEAKANVADASNKNFGGYYAIDLFLRNNSKLADGETAGTAFETLQLNTSSNAQLVTSGSTTTGLQNTVRVALALYQPTSAADVSVVETDQSKILTATTGASATIKDVAIWEPNADQHVAEILKNNNKIKWLEADADLYLTNSVEMGTPPAAKTGYDRADSATHLAQFIASEMTPTYALTGIAADGANRINDVYDWDGSETKFAKQVALQTKKAAATNNYTTVDGGVRNLISSKTSSGEDIYEFGYGPKTTADNVVEGITAETGAQEFQIYKNLIQRVRMYVWLEGQDVDCTNYASHGAGIHIDLGLVKGAKVGGVADS